MKIIGNFSTSANNSSIKKQNYSQNPIHNQMNYDSLSFTSDQKKKKNGFTARVAAFLMAVQALVTPATATQKKIDYSQQQQPTTSQSTVVTDNQNQAEQNYQIAGPSSPVDAIADAQGAAIVSQTKDLYYDPSIIDDYSSYTPSVDELKNNNEFQQNQSIDAPSITFDFTDNFKARTITPLTQSVSLVDEAHKDNWYELLNLRDVIKEVYVVREKDKEITYMVAQAILKANPELAKEVMLNLVDYSDGDITNIDPEIILDTDYLASLSNKQRKIFLPEVNVFEEMRNDHDTTVVLSAEFEPLHGNKDALSSITIQRQDLAYAKTSEDIINIVEQKLAKEYGINTMSSFAGDAIWHGISLWENNEEMFKKSSEKDVKAALANYINKYHGATIECPRIPVTVIDDKDNLKDYGSTKEMLMDKKLNNVTISYLTPDRAVIDMSAWDDKTIAPIDILDVFTFTDGVSIKEAFEENNDKYKALALAGFRQIIDNNNMLSDYFNKVDELQISDLYTPIDIEKLCDKYGYDVQKESRINLQPLAFAHLNPYECSCDCNKPDTVVHECKCDEEPTPTNPPITVVVDEVTNAPTVEPTTVITDTPTEVVTEAPTEVVTEAPTEVVTETPTVAPTEVVTDAPTDAPTEVVTDTPTVPPTDVPPTTPPTDVPPTTPPTDVPPTTPPTDVPPTTPPTDAPTTCPPLPDVPRTDDDIDLPKPGPTTTPPVDDPTTPPTTPPTEAPVKPTTPPNSHNESEFYPDAGDTGADFDDEPESTPTTAPTAAPTAAPTQAPESTPGGNDNDNDAGDNGVGFDDDLGLTRPGSNSSVTPNMVSEPTDSPATAPAEETPAPSEEQAQTATEPVAPQESAPTPPTIIEQPQIADETYDAGDNGMNFDDEIELASLLDDFIDDDE